MIVGSLLADTIQVPSWIITLIGALVICATGVFYLLKKLCSSALGGIVMMYVGVLAMGNALYSNRSRRSSRCSSSKNDR